MTKRNGVADKPNRRAIEREEEHEAAKYDDTPTKKRTPPTLERAGLVVVEDDARLVAEAGTAIRSFLASLAAFFTTAKEIELGAMARVEQARKLTAPTTAAEDVQIQGFVRVINADRKFLEEHWKITALVHGFHRRLTGRRGISETALIEAGDRAQRLHNAYVLAEQERARQETLRREREENERAEKERARELARMEAEAIKREETNKDLSERERIFVDLFMGDSLTRGDAAKSAQRAGFKDPIAAGARLLGLAKIQAAIQAKREAEEIRRQAEAKAKAPLDYRPVDDVKPNVAKAPGAVDRDTHSAELLDEEKLIAAVLQGGHGIPWDILRVDPAMLNTYARSLHERINRWPGVRYKKTTRTI